MTQDTELNQNKCKWQTHWGHGWQVQIDTTVSGVWWGWQQYRSIWSLIHLCTAKKVFPTHTVTSTDLSLLLSLVFHCLISLYLAFPLYVCHTTTEEGRTMSDPVQLLSPSLLTLSLQNLITSSPYLLILLISALCPSPWLIELCHRQIPSPWISKRVPHTVCRISSSAKWFSNQNLLKHCTHNTNT